MTVYPAWQQLDSESPLQASQVTRSVNIPRNVQNQAKKLSPEAVLTNCWNEKLEVIVIENKPSEFIKLAKRVNKIAGKMGLSPIYGLENAYGYGRSLAVWLIEHTKQTYCRTQFVYSGHNEKVLTHRRCFIIRWCQKGYVHKCIT